MNTASRIRAYSGPALFSFGFRPFFLLACAWPALTVPIWVAAYLGYPPFAGLFTRDWHVHEMLFGYLSAVMAGFLLTAIPNWTGGLPVIGMRLAALVSLWIAGRLSMLAAPPALWPAAVDSLFLLVFAAVVWREVIVGRNWRNLPVCGLVSLMAVANIGVHLRPWSPDLAAGAERLALAVAALMIALIGGRITPSFTRNWLTQRKAQRLPAASSKLDIAALAISVIALALWVARPAAPLAGLLLAAAGGANLVRLLRWQGLQTWPEPLVWVLHNGFAWLALALCVLGAAALWPDLVPVSAGIHALTAGAVGVMTLAVMTRAILGHTGRPREAGPETLAIYLLANLAACLRLAAAFDPARQPLLLGLSAGAWAFAFGAFVLHYGPMCLGRRADHVTPRSPPRHQRDAA